jgi:hypothetical protein
LTQVTIYTDNTISIGSTITGYRVSQTADGTVVRKTTNNGHPVPRDMGDVVPLPHKTYALSTDRPASGNPGRAQFDADLTAIWNSVA